MSQTRNDQQTAQIEITNIGGINQSALTLHSGVNVLTGKNATNRTSFLQAIMAVSGSEQTSLKADAEQGEVVLMMGEDQYTRTITRQNGSLSFDGQPYLDDPILADLFAFLLENNEARQAVARGDDLREILMRPVDTIEIEREITNLQSERDEIDTQLQRLDSLEEQLPNLEANRRQLEDKIADKEAELADKTSQIESLDTTVDETREEKNAYESKIDTLSQARKEHQRIEKRIESERESIKSLQTDRDELTEELESYDRVPDTRISEIEGEVQRLRGQMQQIDSTVSDLQSVIQFNDEFLEEGRPPFLQDLDGDNGSTGDELTEQLVSGLRTSPAGPVGVASRRPKSNPHSMIFERYATTRWISGRRFRARSTICRTRNPHLSRHNGPTSDYSRNSLLLKPKLTTVRQPWKTSNNSEQRNKRGSRASNRRLTNSKTSEKARYSTFKRRRVE